MRTDKTVAEVNIERQLSLSFSAVRRWIHLGLIRLIGLLNEGYYSLTSATVTYCVILICTVIRWRSKHFPHFVPIWFQSSFDSIFFFAFFSAYYKIHFSKYSDRPYFLPLHLHLYKPQYSLVTGFINGD